VWLLLNAVQSISKKYFRSDYQTIDLVGRSTAQASTNVTHFAIPCHWSERKSVLADVVLVYGGVGPTIVFTETKKEANELATDSTIASDCQVLHGDIAQSQREITLRSFRERKFKVLVATDVAARGLDIKGVDLVIQAEPPRDHETYIHRSGRTGRAGAKGGSTLCLSLFCCLFVCAALLCTVLLFFLLCFALLCCALLCSALLCSALLQLCVCGL